MNRKVKPFKHTVLMCLSKLTKSGRSVVFCP